MKSNKGIQLLLIMFCAIIHLFTQSQTIVINEIMASNDTTIADEDGDFEDWIELINLGNDPVSLLGYGLTDKPDMPFKWVFPDKLLQPGEILLVFASGKDRKHNSSVYDANWFEDFHPIAAYWPCDEGSGNIIHDLSGNSNHGVLLGATRVPWGIYGGALHFDASNQHEVRVLNAPTLQINQNMTISMWLNPSTYGGNPWHKSYGAEGSITLTNEGHLNYFWGTAGGNAQPYQGFGSQQPIPLNQWTHIALVRDLDNMHLKWYFDGKHVAGCLSEFESGSASSNNLQMGRGYAGAYNGLIAKPILLPYSASATEVNTMFLIFAGNLHSNFSIASAGETIVLTRPDGVIADQLEAVSLPTDISVGRSIENINEWVYFSEATPGLPNTTQAFGEILDPPLFSQTGGLYDYDFDLTISHTDEDAVILFTLDGSIPNPNNLDGKSYTYKNQYPQYPGQSFGELLIQQYQTHTYEQAIAIYDRSFEDNKLSLMSSTVDFCPSYFPENPVSKGFVVRAIAIKENSIPSEIITQTYFVNHYSGDNLALPIISLAINEDAFFGYDDGNYNAGIDFDYWRIQNPDSNPYDWEKPANYFRRGDQFEIPANIEYFEPGFINPLLNQRIGLRIHGSSSRYFPAKSFRLHAKNTYGNSHLTHSIFKNEPYNSYKRLLLRNSGQDWPLTLIRDPSIQAIVAELNFDRQAYQPAVVYVNGEYWGIQNIRERYDNYYLERSYNIDPENIDFIELNSFVVYGDAIHYSTMLNYMENNDLSSDQHYHYIKTQMDIENYIDYMISNIFARNTDWPGNNLYTWRLRTSAYMPNAPLGHDGRWRWMMFDTEFGFGLIGGVNGVSHNTLAFAAEPNGPGWPNPPWSTFIFRQLLQNQAFRYSFINRFADLLNTLFLPENTVFRIDSITNWILPEIPNHIARWKSPPDLDAWHANIDVMKFFANERPAHQRQHILEFFNLQSTHTIKVDIDNANAGVIQINTITLEDGKYGIVGNPYPWQGLYYKNIPLNIKAIAKPGYIFSHWEGLPYPHNPQQTIFLHDDLQIKAFFEFVGVSELLFFWYFDTQLPNDQPLECIAPIFSHAEDAMLDYESCLEGYPFFPGHPNWRKASMERRNAPTPINYLPEANDSIPYNETAMRGIQIKQPFVDGEKENALIFHLPSTGYRDLIFRFAAKDEGAASYLLIDYCLSESAIEWSNEGLSSSNLTLGNDYTLYEVGLSGIYPANNNAFLKIRIRFAGPNMSADEGDRVTFNNFSLHGNPDTVIIENEYAVSHTLSSIKPNPFGKSATVLFSISESGHVHLLVLNMFGRIVSTLVDVYLEPGNYSQNIDGSVLTPGFYFLHLYHNGQYSTTKIIHSE
jgi:hypothetical protein